MGHDALSIRLLGGIELSMGDRILPVPTASKVRSLLAYLILHPNRALPRDRLVGLFWGDRSDLAGRRALSHALWKVRRNLGPAGGRLVTDREVVYFQLWPGDTLDTLEFEQLCAAGWPIPRGDGIRRLREAVALYRGDLLEEVFDDWVLIERERLRELYLRTLERLIQALKQAGNYEEALVYARRLVRADPLREEAHCELMRLLSRLGRYHEALRQYEALREELREELGLDPSSEAQALYREIARCLGTEIVAHLTLPPPAPSRVRDLSRLPFVGREEERRQLAKAIQEAAQGHGQVLRIEGSAGVGKSRLVEEAADHARWLGFQVGVGRANSEAVAPYQLFSDALTPLLTPLRLSQLAELVDPLWLSVVRPLLPPVREGLPELLPPPPLDPPHEQQRLWQGLFHLLRGLTQIAPLLLVLEDLHWADEASLEVLLHLTPRTRDSRLLWILTCRSAEARERSSVRTALEALDQRHPGRRLRLRPFSLEETAALLRHALGEQTQTPLFVRRLWSETGGNALVLVETLKAWLEEGRPEDVGSPPLAWNGRPFGSLQETLTERMARLPPQERSILELASVLGKDVEFPLLAALVGDPVLTVQGLEGLERRGFLVREETCYRFEHDRIRESIYESIPPDRRREIHRRVGEVTEALHPERVKALAHHFEMGEAWGPALRYHREAGDRAAALHAYPTALRHYEEALQLAEERVSLSPGEHFELLARHERIADLLGHRDRQAADLRAMLRLSRGDPHRQLQTYQRQIGYLAHVGRYRAAETLARRALELAAERNDRSAESALLIALGLVLNWAGQPAQAIPYLERAVEIQKDRGDLRGKAKAHSVLGNALLGIGEYARAEVELGQALALYTSLENRVEQAEILGLLGILHMERGEADVAVNCYRQTLELCRETHYRFGEARAMANLGNVLFLQGRLSEALELYNEAVRIFEAIGHARGEAGARLNRASVLCNLLGDARRARKDVDQALSYALRSGNRFLEAHGESVLGELGLLEGRLEEARVHLERALELSLELEAFWNGIQVLQNLALVALREGRPAEALQRLEQAEELCLSCELSEPLVGIWALEGWALLKAGQIDRAVERTHKAMAHLNPAIQEGYRVPYAHALVLTALGHHEAAWAALDQAHQMLHAYLQDFPESLRQLSLRRVPIHRAIEEAWEERRPRRITLPLPREGAPKGRPLSKEDWVQVTWTLVAPEDMGIENKVARRRHRLLRLLQEAQRQGAAPTVEHLAEALQVGVRTVKRDLAALRTAGYETPTRGHRQGASGHFSA